MRLFITGASSFLGQHLLSTLLQAGHEVALLLPHRYSASPHPLRAVLPPGLFQEGLSGRPVRIFFGSSMQDRLGQSVSDYDELCRWTESIVHCPRGANFKERYTQGLRLENLRRTEGILAFAAQSNSRHLHFVSSAYVCGLQQGLIREEEPTDHFGFRNQYEWFKYQAECMVSDFHRKHGLPVSIYRPSIILENPGAMGLTQAIALQIDWLANLTRTVTGAGLAECFRQGVKFTVAGNPEATLNIISVDYCARAIARMVQEMPEAASRIYHLVNPQPPTIGLLTRTVGEVFGIETQVNPTLGPEVAWTANLENNLLRRLERLIYRSYRVYLPYHYDNLTFDDSNTRLALADTGIVCPLIDQPVLVKFLRQRLQHRLNQFSGFVDWMVGA